MEYFSELLNILNAMSPYLLLGFLVAGLMHAYIPKRAFSKYLSKRGFRSVFLSALFGVPLPLCSCGVIPTAMSLKKEGASDGATVSFLIATPQTGIDSILATYGVLGLPFAIIRPIVALIVGVVGGVFVDRFSDGKGNGVEASATKCCCSPLGGKKQPKLVTALKYGFVDMLQDLGLWLFIGLVVAAVITAFVPSGFFEVLGEHYALNILVVLLLSIPMYICSTGSIPIALSLLMMGISPGAALVFLMAGPATNIAALAVVRKVLGLRVTVIYLLSIVIGAIAFTLFIDFVLPVEWFTARLSVVSSSAHCEGGAQWWQITSSVLFMVLLISAYISKFRKGHSHTHESEVVKVQKFRVSGMRCNHCKANVEKAIVGLHDVESVAIELSGGIVEVKGDVLQEDVRRVVRELGFEIE